jgi:hypothetical protein
MREIRTSGSVRGEEGNLLTYSTSGFLGRKRGCARQHKPNLRGPAAGDRGAIVANKANSAPADRGEVQNQWRQTKPIARGPTPRLRSV